MDGSDSERTVNGGLIIIGGLLVREARIPGSGESRLRMVLNGDGPSSETTEELMTDAVMALFDSVSPTTRNHRGERWKSSKSPSVSCSTCRWANMTFLLTFLSALGLGVLLSSAKTQIALMCLAEITESAGWDVGEEKYKSLTIVISSLTVSECWMSSRMNQNLQLPEDS